MVALIAGAIVVVGAAWLLLVSPERHKAADLATQVASAQAQLASAESQLHNARAAQQQYASSYSAVVDLGKAVPASQEVPSLIYQLQQASEDGGNVAFASISTANAASGPSSASTPAAAAATAAAGAAPTSFTQMPFTLAFDGTFFNLEHLFDRVSRFTAHTASGIAVSGRLLTVQSVKLAPVTTSGSEATGNRPLILNGTITATAYVLPASQGLTSGATPSGPAGSATPASSSSGTSSPTAPAVARVTP
jgi:Tfp pilus assembly protein PilO